VPALASINRGVLRLRRCAVLVMKRVIFILAVLVLAAAATRGLPDFADADEADFGPSVLILDSTPGQVQVSPDWVPRVVAAKSDTWIAVWHSDDPLDGRVGRDNDIFFTRSRDKGGTWSDPQPLNTNAADDSGDDRLPSIATDGNGDWIAVWQTTDSLAGTIRSDLDIVYARSLDDGATWTDPRPLTADAAKDWGSDTQPQIATDSAGNWLAVWTSTDGLGHTLGGDSDILISRSSDTGKTWSAARALTPTQARADSGYDRHPRIVHGRGGTWLVAWTSNDTLAGRIGRDADILYSRSEDAGKTWRSPSELNLNAEDDHFGDQNAQLATDGRGRWVAVWESQDPLGATIGEDADVLVARSSDDGARWSAPQALNKQAATDARDDLSPHVATDGAGSWMVVWDSTSRLAQPDIHINGLDYDMYQSGAGSDADVFVSRSQDAGASWSAPVMAVAAAGREHAEDTRPYATTDGGGNWIIVWQSTVSRGTTGAVDWGVVAAVGRLAPRSSRR